MLFRSAALKKGLDTLVVDLDPQGNATSLLRSQRGRGTAATALADPGEESTLAAIAASGWRAASGRVRLMASDPELITFDAWKPERKLRPRLARALRHIPEQELILIDCPPSLGALTREALAASDLAVVVTTPSYFGAQGADRAIAEIKEIKATLNPDLEFAGVVVNRMKEKTEEHRWRKKELVTLYGAGAVLKPSIPDRVAIQQAESPGEPLHALKSSGAREVAKDFDKLLGRLLRIAKEQQADS